MSDKQEEREIHKGLTGLTNLGNTCFLNSCIQILAHTPIFTVLKEKYEKYKKPNILDTIILNEFEALRELMINNEGVIKPDKFVFAVHKIAHIKNRPLFTGWAQNDMPEFLLFLFECIHNSICRPVNIDITGHANTMQDILAQKCYNELKTIYEKEFSEIMHSFYGIYYSEFISLEEPYEQLSVKPEQYFILDLPIPREKPDISIYDCFDLYCNNDLLSGENAWFNEKTGEKQEVAKRIRFFNFPDILVITFKRFTQDGTHKLQNHIDFPLTNLDMSKYVHGYNAQSYLYDLYGVCNHMGGVSGGHYTSFVKHYDIMNGIWLHHNDTYIDIVKEDQVVSPTAYCLFFRKR